MGADLGLIPINLTLTPLSNLTNWSALIFQGFVNFVLPCILFYKARRTYPTIVVPSEFQGPEQSDSTSLEPENAEPPKELDSDEENATAQDGIIDDEVSDKSINRTIKPRYIPFVDAVPESLRINPKVLAVIIGIVMFVLCTATIVMDIVFLALGINLVG